MNKNTDHVKDQKTGVRDGAKASVPVDADVGRRVEEDRMIVAAVTDDLELSALKDPSVWSSRC